MKFLKSVLKKNIAAIMVFLVTFISNLLLFFLYDIFIEPAVYSAIVALFFLICVLSVEYIKEKKKSQSRKYVLASISSDWKSLPEAFDIAEEDYQEMIKILGEKIEKISEEFSESRQDSLDYYTNWVHQIKTPIAVMKLKLAEDTPENRALSSELFRIEQYVDMVLQYIRLGSESTDLVIKEYSLDEIIRESIRKFAPQFIEKKLTVEYSDSGKTIITDKKWMLCILDQLLSNAIKYTPSGTISISSDDNCIIVTDTGIGISEEDLPRIFEKGYTGNNGRIGQKSSGLGLYLAKKSADLISVALSVDSSVGKGTTFILKKKEKIN